MSSTISSRRRAGVLYAGVAVFIGLAAFTTRSIWIAWQERSGEAKAEAVFDLVQQRMPSRPTEAPGAMAWLRLQLENYERHITDSGRARRYRSFAAAGDRVPDELLDVLAVMRAGGSPGRSAGAVTLIAPADPEDRTSLRRQRLAQFAGRTLVITRRRALD